MARRPGNLQLQDFLPYRLSVLSNLTSNAIATSYAQRFNLTIPEWRVLAVLAQTADLSAAEVATRTAMDKVAVSRAVAALLKSRRIHRAIAASDRRRSSLRLTNAGLAVYAEVAPIAASYEQELLRPLDPGDRAALDRILRVLLGRAMELGPAHQI